MAASGKSVKPRPADPAMWEDSFLRPWTLDEELDAKIDAENALLDDCIQKTSGSKIAGVRGLSEIDAKPQQFLDFERFTSNPGWLYRLGSDAMDAEDERMFAEMVAAAQAAVNAETDSQLPETNSMTLINQNDNLLLNSILEFNHALYANNNNGSVSGSLRRDAQGALGAGPRGGADSLRAKTEAFQHFIDLRASLRKSKMKKKSKPSPVYSLKSIRYSPLKNPKVLNVSTVEFQSLLQRFNMTMPSQGMGSKSKSAPMLLSQLQSTVQERNERNMRSTTNTSEGASEQEAQEQRSRDMDALTQFLVQSGLTAPPAGAAVGGGGGAGAGGGGGGGGPLLAPVPEEKELGLSPLLLTDSLLSENDFLRPLSTQSPLKPGSARPSTSPMQLGSPVRPQSTSLLLRGTEFSVEERALLGDLPTSPIQRAASARPASRMDESLQRGPSAVVLQPLATGGPGSPGKIAQPSPTPRLRPPTSSSEARVVGRQSTPALNKLSIAPSQGTIVSSNTGTLKHSLGKAKLKDIRTLRDQLMSTSGSLAMNVHPEASPDAQADAKESVRVTKEMVKETIEKNRVDQTWTLLATPGFYEAVGPEQIFQAESAVGYLVNDKFLKSIKEADVTQGIKRDPLRVWSEDGVKNKIKIFQSGGAMKM